MQGLNGQESQIKAVLYKTEDALSRRESIVNYNTMAICIANQSVILDHSVLGCLMPPQTCALNPKDTFLVGV